MPPVGKINTKDRTLHWQTLLYFSKFSGAMMDVRLIRKTCVSCCFEENQASSFIEKYHSLLELSEVRNHVLSSKPSEQSLHFLYLQVFKNFTNEVKRIGFTCLATQTKKWKIEETSSAELTHLQSRSEKNILGESKISQCTFLLQKSL